MPNRTSKLALMKIIKALIDDNINKTKQLRDRDIIINNLNRRLERSKI